MICVCACACVRSNHPYLNHPRLVFVKLHLKTYSDRDFIASLGNLLVPVIIICIIIINT